MTKTSRKPRQCKSTNHQLVNEADRISKSSAKTWKINRLSDLQSDYYESASRRLERRMFVRALVPNIIFSRPNATASQQRCTLADVSKMRHQIAWKCETYWISFMLAFTTLSHASLWSDQTPDCYEQWKIALFHNAISAASECHHFADQPSRTSYLISL